MAKRCSTSTVTQSVVFPKRWGIAKAKAWLKSHGLKAIKVDVEKNTLRFRQLPPSKCKRGNFASIPMGATGVRKIICCPE